MDTDASLIYKIAITKVPSIGPKTAKNLISYLGGLDNVFAASKKELQTVPGVGLKTADLILNKAYFEAAEKEVAYLAKHNIDTHFYLDDTYPKVLRNYEDQPVLLYTKGVVDFNHRRSVGVIGTRNATSRGTAFTEKLVADFAAADIHVISGLAHGIDGAAHKAACDNGLYNMAVLGHGIDTVYPAAHRGLAKRVEECGMLVTEFGIGVKPDRERFPMRNRIIAGLCDALLVIESKERGGSMVTVEFAENYNKDVFAVPGRTSDVYSKGCNKLIRRHKAGLIENIDDLLYFMNWDVEEGGHQSELFVELTEEEHKVVEVIRQHGEIEIDFLVKTLGITQSNLAPLLLNLELNNLVQALPGKKYTVL